MPERKHHRCRTPHRPFIAPMRDPLALWGCIGDDSQAGRCWLRYFANRKEARQALRTFDPKTADR